MLNKNIKIINPFSLNQCYYIYILIFDKFQKKIINNLKTKSQQNLTSHTKAMPKVVDNYILQQKIGAGQFGDVFKGYHQITKQEVAIKAIRRETIKGKFHELLQNQIRVLKTCDNQNIIKLYAIKKTINHFYLILQYCNQGDMLSYIRKNGNNLSEQKIIRYLCQILNAFKDLVRYKIMHRDFKLANILLHDGNIKIADFGFAKLLSHEEYATTMLGSPLNMAPEVLGGNKYNSKADIWSIGSCLWQMIFGRPPYVAGNMVDLLNLIKTKPLKFPVNLKISEDLTDVIKRMLIADPRRRISWQQLFNHKINTYLLKQLKKQINLQLVQDESLLINTSKFYLKNNLFIDNINNLHQNNEINQYLLNIIKNKKKFIQSQDNHSINNINQNYINKSIQNHHPQIISKKQSKYHSNQKDSTSKKKSKQPQQNLNKSALEISFRKNIKKIMHFRNIYVFLVNVSDQILSSNCLKIIDVNYQQNQLIAYLLIHKILQMIKWLISAIKSNKCMIDNLQNWQQFKESKQLNEISNYIINQLKVFQIFNQSIQPTITSGILSGKFSQDIRKIIQNQTQETNYKVYLKSYIKKIAKQTINKMLIMKKIDMFIPALKHIENCLIAFNNNQIFGKQGFNFCQFYDRCNQKCVEERLIGIEKMVKQL